MIDTATNTVVARAPVGFSGSVAITPDGSRAYVTSSGVLVKGHVTTPPMVWVVTNTATNAVVATVQTGRAPAGVAITPDGTRVYVPSGDGVGVIDTASNQVVATIGVVDAVDVAITPDGTRAYVTSPGPTQDNTVSVIDTATNTVVATVGVGDGPVGVAVSPDGARVYVASPYFGPGSGTVAVIDTATNVVVATVSVPNTGNLAVGPIVSPLPAPPTEPPAQDPAAVGATISPTTRPGRLPGTLASTGGEPATLPWGLLLLAAGAGLASSRWVRRRRA